MAEGTGQWKTGRSSGRTLGGESRGLWGFLYRCDRVPTRQTQQTRKTLVSCQPELGPSSASHWVSALTQVGRIGARRVETAETVSVCARLPSSP